MRLFWDNASTTPVKQAVIEVCADMMKEGYFNPSATYASGANVRRRVEKAREEIASALHVAPDTLTFVSGATEANNWVMQAAFKNRKGNLVLSEGEHPSVYQPAMAWKSKGYDVRTVGLRADGRIDEEAFAAAVDADTTLVSVIHCSNETGTCNPIQTLVSIMRERAPHALFHSDGVQAFKKIPVDLTYLDVDLYSVSAHKIGGPKGVGALYSRRPLPPMLLGGGQESNARSGTENTYGIVGFARAVADYTSIEAAAIELLRAKLLEIEGSRIHGDCRYNSGYIVSVSFAGVKAEVLQHMLSDRGIDVGTGSACASRSKNNRILAGMGVGRAEIEGNVRISPGFDVTEAEILQGVEVIRECVEILRGKIYGTSYSDTLR